MIPRNEVLFVSSFFQYLKLTRIGQNASIPVGNSPFSGYPANPLFPNEKRPNNKTPGNVLHISQVTNNLGNSGTGIASTLL